MICTLYIFNSQLLDRCVCDLKYKFVNAVCISALLYELIFQLYKAMYYQLSLVAIQICVVGFIFHNEYLRFIFHYRYV